MISAHAHLPADVCVLGAFLRTHTCSSRTGPNPMGILLYPHQSNNVTACHAEAREYVLPRVL